MVRCEVFGADEEEQCAAVVEPQSYLFIFLQLQQYFIPGEILFQFVMLTGRRMQEGIAQRP